jgi:hypothetical protein
MLFPQRHKHRHFNWAIIFICLAFLAIRISGVHAHHHILLTPADSAIGATTMLDTDFHHIVVGLFHHDHSDLADHHDESEPSPATLVHQDVKIDAFFDGFGKTSKLNQQQFSILATVLLWHLMPAPPSVIPRYRAPTGGPHRSRLRPPSCGPPTFFIA